MLADLHADTLYECFVHQKTMDDTSLHIHHLIFEKIEGYLQNFACYIPEDTPDKWRFLQEFIAFGQKKLRDMGFKMSYETASMSRGHSAILSVENCDVFDESEEPTDKLLFLKNNGVHIISLVYNHTGRLGCGAFSEQDEGLSLLGRRVVSAANKTGMILDVSHASRKSAEDILLLASAPVLATHFNAFSLCPHPRNLTDEQIVRIAESGGLIGVNLYPPFLSEKVADRKDVAKHIQYMVNLCGEDHVALGGDLDGVERLPSGVKNLGSLLSLTDELHKCGIGETAAEKIFYKNVMNFAKENFGGKHEIH